MASSKYRQNRWLFAIWKRIYKLYINSIISCFKFSEEKKLITFSKISADNHHFFITALNKPFRYERLTNTFFFNFDVKTYLIDCKLYLVFTINFFNNKDDFIG